MIHCDRSSAACGIFICNLRKYIFLILVYFLPCVLTIQAASTAVRLQIVGTVQGQATVKIDGQIIAQINSTGNISGGTSLSLNKSYQIAVEGSFSSLNLSLRVPPEYSTWINGSEVRLIQSQSSVSKTGSLDIRPTNTNSNPGTSSRLEYRSDYWGVSLGRLPTGADAGSLVIATPTTSEFTPSRSILACKADTAKVTVYSDATGLRQVLAPEAFVDIIDDVGQENFTISFYEPSDAQGASFPRVISAQSTPFATYVIGKGSQSRSLYINKITPDGTITTGKGPWGTVTTGYDINDEIIIEEIQTEAVGTDKRRETITLKNGRGNIASKTTYTYQVFAWNRPSSQGKPALVPEELVEIIQHPGNSTETLVTSYTYYTDNRNSGYGQVRSVTYPDGKWIKYIYNNVASVRGVLHKTVTPWLDGPALVPADGDTTFAHCLVTEYNYIYESPFYTDWLPSSIKTTVNGVVISQVSGEASFNQSASDFVGGILKMFTYSTTQAGTALTTTQKRFQNAGTALPANRTSAQFLENLPISTSYPDGTKIAYEYRSARVNENGQEVLYQSQTEINAIVETIYTGYTNPITLADGTHSISHSPDLGDPISFDPESIHLVPQHSIKTVRLRHNGRTLKEETFLFLGLDQRSDYQWTRITWSTFTYSSIGDLLERKQGNGETNNHPSSYVATYRGTFKTSETMESGITYEYVPDNFGRIKTATQTEASPVYVNHLFNYVSDATSPAQPARTTQYSYDAAGRTISKLCIATDALPLEETVTYDHAGRLTLGVDFDGRHSATTYNTGNRTVTQHMACGGQTTTTHYLDGRIKSVTGAGIVSKFYTYEISQDGSIISTVTQGSASSGVWEKTVTDKIGRVLRSIVPAATAGEIITAHSYDSRGRLIKTTKTHNDTPVSAPLLRQYDALGRLADSGFDMNNDGELTPESPDRYTHTSITYSWGDPIYGTTYPQSLWLKKADTVYTSYNPPDTQVQGTYTTATQTTFTRLTGLFFASSETCIIDPFGNWTRSVVEHEPERRLFVSQTSYSAIEEPNVSINHNGVDVAKIDQHYALTTYTYDGLGRLILTSPHLGRAIRTTYLERSDGFSTTLVQERRYDGPEGILIAGYEYDSAGRTSKTFDATGADTRYEYNCDGRLTARYGSGGYPVRYNYDHLGRLTQQRTFRNLATHDEPPPLSGGDVTQYAYYGDTHYIQSVTDAAGRIQSYTFDPLGRVKTHTNARGQLKDYNYDANTGELLRIGYPLYENNSERRFITYTYGRNGAPATVQDPITGLRTFVYCDESAYDTTLDNPPPTHHLQLVREDLPVAFYGEKSLNYSYETYDPDEGYGRPDKLRGYSLSDKSRPYDPELSVIYDNTSYSMNQIAGVICDNTYVAYAYQPFSPRIMETTIWEIGLTRSNVWTDEFPHLPDAVSTALSGNLVDAHHYEYDAVGRRTTHTRHAEISTSSEKTTTRQFNYNLKSELVSCDAFSWSSGTPNNAQEQVPERSWQFAYDAIGNRTGYVAESLEGGQHTKSYTSNNINQYNHINSTLGSQGAVSLLYDADGNLIDDGIWTYGFDAFNRLVEMQHKNIPAGSGNAALKLKFAYDYLGRRVEKNVFTWSHESQSWLPDAARSRRFIYQGWNLIVEIAHMQPSAPTLACYYWGLDSAGNLSQTSDAGALLAIRREGFMLYPTFDGNGNVTGLIDGQGVPSASYEYDPFGQLIGCSGDYAMENPFRFSTKYTDDETGLVYYGFRYYDSANGRFINRDPIGEAGGLNLYGFVANNPQNRVDILGLSSDEVLRTTNETNGKCTYVYEVRKQTESGQIYTVLVDTICADEIIQLDKMTVTANKPSYFTISIDYGFSNMEAVNVMDSAGPLDNLIKDIERQNLCHELRVRRNKLGGEYNQFERTAAELDGRKPNSLNFGSGVLTGGSGSLAVADSANILPIQTVSASVDHFDFTKINSSSTKITPAGGLGIGLTGAGILLDTSNAMENFSEGNYAKGIQYSITTGVGVAVLRGAVVRAGAASAIGSPVFGAAVGVISVMGDVGGTMYANSIINESYSSLHKTAINAARSHFNIIQNINSEMEKYNCN